MAEIKPLALTASKWQRRTSSAAGEYAEGVKNTQKDWARNTADAEGNYEAGIQAGIARKAFGKGVVKAGTESWRTGAIEKGVPRFPAGVAGAQDKYNKGFKPYHEAIANLALPPRGPVGDPGNINRVAVIADTLHQTKLNLKG